jgi:hypothetical protein
MATMRKFSSAFGLMATTSEPLQLQTLKLVERERDNKGCDVQDNRKECRDLLSI